MQFSTAPDPELLLLPLSAKVAARLAVLSDAPFLVRRASSRKCCNVFAVRAEDQSLPHRHLGALPCDMWPVGNIERPVPGSCQTAGHKWEHF